MALADNASSVAAKFASLSIPRQIGLLVGIAASIALGIAVALWSRSPSFVPLFSQLSPKDAAEAISALERNNIQYSIEQGSGLLIVPAEQLQMARFKLAAEGIPRSEGGSDMFSNGGVFGSSQMAENARYKQALEAELARTISKFNDVKAARVHLAIPRESAFVRDSQAPSASVFIDVYSGVDIKKQTISAIVNLVASSIPSLSSSRVTVVDQDGQLLSEGGGQTTFSETDRFFDYRQSLEQQYSKKIQDILTPLLGYGRVRAKVSADIDFTTYEQTQEQFNPQTASLRSEQKMEEKHSASAAEGGVPGSLANTPQAIGALPQNQGKPATPQAAAAGMADSGGNSKVQSTKNFELDKTISHTRKQPGTIKRLTVAVVVDNRTVVDEKTKKVDSKPLTKKEIEQIKLLVSDAIGIDAKRGDSLNVINQSFVKPDPIDRFPEEEIWQKDIFWSIVKQAVAALFVLALIFGALRPMLKTLANNKHIEQEGLAQKSTIQGSNMELTLKDASDFDTQLRLLRQVVDKEPQRVAQVVKNWVEKG